jgi:hypothetical protein
MLIISVAAIPSFLPFPKPPPIASLSRKLKIITFAKQLGEDKGGGGIRITRRYFSIAADRAGINPRASTQCPFGADTYSLLPWMLIISVATIPSFLPPPKPPPIASLSRKPKKSPLRSNWGRTKVGEGRTIEQRHWNLVVERSEERDRGGGMGRRRRGITSRRSRGNKSPR